MQDEVSETENIRKNLSIERMIVEGCDILLDVNQTFVRQGNVSFLLIATHSSLLFTILFISVQTTYSTRCRFNKRIMRERHVLNTTVLVFITLFYFHKLMTIHV